MARILELKGISKAFGGLQVIDGLNLHVDEGEIVSVIGPNGAGKTTLFNLITGVYRPDHGEILLDGSWTSGAASGGGRLGDWAGNWVVLPTSLAGWVSPVTYIGLVAAVLLLTVVTGRLRLVLLVPTLYLAAFVWENVMRAKPEPTRFVILGAILVAVMIARPEGILGEKRVEIV